MSKSSSFNVLIARILTSACVVAGGLVATAGPALAQTETADLEVSAEVTASCSISTAPLVFGNYDPIVTHASSPLDQEGTVTVTCTSGASTAITLGQGLQPTGTSTDAIPDRRMISGVNFLSYDLYTTAGRTVIWGNTSGTSVAHTGTGTSTDLTVFGRIPPAQNRPAGTYTDTVVATVTF